MRGIASPVQSASGTTATKLLMDPADPQSAIIQQLTYHCTRYYTKFVSVMNFGASAGGFMMTPLG